MLITRANLDALFTGFKTSYQAGFDSLKDDERFEQWLATTAPSTTSEETYPWLGEIDGMREWIGARVIRGLSEHGYSIINRDFELTVGLDANRIKDDRYGLYAPRMQMMGQSVARQPSQILIDLVNSAHQTKCYDGQFFFDTDHPRETKDGTIVSESNAATGPGPAWYLFDVSKPLRPFIYQNREEPQFVSLTRPDDASVFSERLYIYGAARRNAVGLGLWQLAYRSTQELTPATFVAAYSAMKGRKGDKDIGLGVRATHLMVPSTLWSTGREIVETATLPTGGGNPNAGLVTLVDTPHLND